ncbi:MAG: hypothetical protein FJZ13_01930 [Candidatus Omnitrophica bacterium]|nr:hypothetical protein [Candidatus Omnitrophota bacterium]
MRNKLMQRLLLLISMPICILFIFISSVFSDTVKLKSSREINGRLKEITDKDVVLEMGPGTIWFGKEEVESINGLSIEEAKARLSTEGAFITQDMKQAITSSAQEGLNFVSKTRKLEFKAVPEIEIANKDKIKEYLKQNIEKEYNQEKLSAKIKLWLRLGLISKMVDYQKEVLEPLTEAIAGYYNSDDKKIYVSEDIGYAILPGLPSMTVMHEQVHALQDQYHNLKSIEDSLLLANEDKGLAIESVIEGEATVLMYDAFFRSSKGLGMFDPAKEFDLRSFVIDSMLAYSKHFKTGQRQPAIFMEALLFPYVWGGSFIQHLVNTKGWEAIDEIYLDMPTSSEQIMHPEKYYIVRDEPEEVNFVDVSTILGSSWIRLSRGVLGEFSFYLIGKVFLDELSNKLMSEGWAGDYFEFYEEPNLKQTLLISASKWDSEKEADEFFGFYKKIMEKKYKQPRLVKEDQSFSQWKIGQENIYIFKSKDVVLIIEGASDNIVSNLIGALTI